eukprot:5912943-Pleurochrysis_carterae.AAC.3
MIGDANKVFRLSWTSYRGSHPRSRFSRGNRGQKTAKGNTTGRAGFDGVERSRFLGSAADLHLQYFSLSPTKAAGRPGCCSSRCEPRAERTYQEVTCVVQKSCLHQHSHLLEPSLCRRLKTRRRRIDAHTARLRRQRAPAARFKGCRGTERVSLSPLACPNVTASDDRVPLHCAFRTSLVPAAPPNKFTEQPAQSRARSESVVKADSLTPRTPESGVLILF